MDNFITNGLTFGVDLLNWIVFIEVPAFIFMFSYLQRTISTTAKMLDAHEDKTLKIENALNEKIANYKLEVAQKYTLIAHLKETEKRLSKQLGRIEKKLDRV